MKTIFNKALWASAIGACTLSLGSCTDLSETIYDTIASEKYEFTEKDRAAMLLRYTAVFVMCIGDGIVMPI